MYNTSFTNLGKGNRWKTVRSQPIADNKIILCKYEVEQQTFKYLQSGTVQSINHVEWDLKLFASKKRS
jgi:hypothetical protein